MHFCGVIESLRACFLCAMRVFTCFCVCSALTFVFFPHKVVTFLTYFYCQHDSYSINVSVVCTRLYELCVFAVCVYVCACRCVRVSSHIFGR